MKTIKQFFGILIALLSLVSGVSAGEIASNPNPADGATCVDQNTYLSWSPGDGAIAHNVYFADAAPPTYKGLQVSTTYDPGSLEACTTYYWRIDEVNDPNIWTGDVWSFTTRCGDCNCVPPPENMVAWWAFDEDVITTTAHDSGGWIRDEGTLINGASFISNGKVDGGLELDGVDGYVSVPDSPELNFGTCDFSIDAWIRTDSTETYQVFVDKRDYDPVKGYEFLLYHGKLSLELADAGAPPGWTNYYNPDSNDLRDGEWHLVAVTVDRDDPSGGKLYCDGDLIHTFNPTGRAGDITNSADLWIGRHHPVYIYPYDLWFDGEIDEVELFNRVLDANEIQAIYAAGSIGKCKDCNGNGIPDILDIANGTSLDLNGNGTPDECECSKCDLDPCYVDVVILVDTSSSMLDHVDDSGLCYMLSNIQQRIIDPLQKYYNITANITALGIDEGEILCLQDNLEYYVADYYGTDVPNPSSCGTTLDSCGDEGEGNLENWAPATAIAAANHNWTEGCTRIIIPISDEQPCCGGGEYSATDHDDSDAIEKLITVANLNNNNVVVSPIITTGWDKYLPALVAEKTGGSVYTNLDPQKHPLDEPPQPHRIIDTVIEIISAACHPCVEPPPDMVGWWPFDEEEGPIAHELVYGNVGIYDSVSGPTPDFEGVVNRALKFDGVDDYVHVDDPPDGALDLGTEDFTIDAWVWRHRMSDSNMTIVDKRQTSPERGYRLYLSNGYLGLRLAGSNGILDFVSSAYVTSVVNKDWHHVAVTVERDDCSSGITFYIDGLPVDHFPYPEDIGNIDNDGPLRIGHSVPGFSTDAYYDLIDEVEIFKSDANICAIYQSGNGGKCKKDDNTCNEFCEYNLVPNGSFECGEGFAGPPTDGLGGLGQLLYWEDWGEDIPDWVGEGENESTTQTDKYFKKHEGERYVHAPPSKEVCIWSMFYRCWEPGFPRSYGTRFVHLDRDAEVGDGRNEGIRAELLHPLKYGYKYNISFWAIGRLAVDKPHPQIQWSIGNGFIHFEGNGDEEGAKVLMGTEQCWNYYKNTFAANADHVANSDIKIQVIKGFGLCLDAVSLTMVGGPGSPTALWSFNQEAVSPFIDNSDCNNHGIIHGDPCVVDSVLGQAFIFDGLDDYIEAPNALSLNYGIGNFSTAAWIKLDSIKQSDIPIIDKRDANGIGYRLSLYNGRLALQMADVNGVSNFVADEPIPRGPWVHLAAVVERMNGEYGVLLFINGQVVGFFDPTDRQGSLDNSAPLLIAAGRPADDPNGSLIFSEVEIDDVFMCDVLLTYDEVRGLSKEGRSDSPLEFGHIPSVVSLCGSEATADVNVTICNITKTTGYYEWTLQGLPAEESYCNLAGPNVFEPNSGIVTVPAGSCVSIPVEIVRPEGLVHGFCSYYELVVNNAGSQEFVYEETGKLVSSNHWCVKANSGVTPVEFGTVHQVSFVFTNINDPCGVLDFEYRAVVLDDWPDSQVRLNGQPPEANVPGSISLGIGESDTISVNVEILEHDAGNVHTIQLWFDNDGNGEKEPMASTSLRTTYCGEASYRYSMGDLNQNCHVNMTDFAMLASIWLSELGEPGYNPDFDISIPTNGAIDFSDLVILTNNWLETGVWP